MTDAHYTDDLVLFANTPAEVESRLHSLKKAAGGIGLYVTANKTEFMYFKHERSFYTLSGKPLEFVDQFT